MSASPVPASAPSQKRPLEEPSSPNGPTDQPDAKRPALDKVKDEESVNDAPPASPDVGSEIKSEIKAEVESSEPTAATEDVVSNEGPESIGDTVVLDAPPAGMPSATQVLETQPVQSTAANGASAGGQDQYSAQQQDESNWLHIRAIISSAEAATVIGKGGENVTQIRRMSGAKCTVSDYSRGAVERVLTVSGLVDAVAKVLLNLNCVCRS
jgi:heterogeneous nuclear rnp K-like protein 2